MASHVVSRGHIDLENSDFDDEPNMNKLDVSTEEQKNVIESATKNKAQSDRYTVDGDNSRITADDSLR